MDINTKVNANLHPSKIAGDSQSAKSARHAMEALYIAQGKILDLHEIVHGKALLRQRQVMAAMPAPAKGGRKVAPALIYDPAAASHILEVGPTLAQKALKTADVALTGLTEAATRLDATISQKLTAAKSGRGAELRAWAASQEHPFVALGNLFQAADKNSALVAAVLEGEPFLSGLTPDNQNHLRKAAADVLAPAEVLARKETSDALGHLTSATKSFTAHAAGIFRDLQSPTEGAINQIIKEGNE